METVIGTIAGLARHPVKSMGGESLEEAELGWTGIVGDRQWAFVARDRNSRFPWFTGRDHADLIRYRAAYPDGTDPKTAMVHVTAPDGRDMPINAPELLARLAMESKRSVALLRLGRGAFDAMPVSLVSLGGHAEVEAAHGVAIDLRRFRINIAIDTDLPMRVWAGRRLRFGDDEEAGAEVAIAYRIERCVMITIDPESGAKDPWLMRTVAQQFDNKYGVYANVVRPGPLRRGDPVRLID